ncbi:alpha/beta hydrolase [Phyllobacterium sp. BT25]|uniref:Alpha/beta hydrolase n=2 Tax=Phyllobacterium pellucidum TaxID=2740464 RepID=A0A849VWK3_9HYPH|nr:alpha/beta hydrolase [Phyllobacterium pellucidum]
MVLTACSPGTILNIATTSNGARVEQDVAYGEGPRRTLDVYAPAGAHAAPVAVFFYGGSWQNGDKKTYQFVGSALAAKGIVTVIPDYRLYPQVHYEGFLDDGAKAVRWARDHARQYGGDPAKLFVVGHSAGAYIAAMLALDKTWLGREGMTPNRDLRGFVGIAGPYDFLPSQDEKIAAIFSTAKTTAQAEPVTFAGRHEPPTLLLHGKSDTTVFPRNSTRLAEKLSAGGNTVDIKLYPGVGHLAIIGAMGSPMRFVAPTLDDTANFVRAHSNRKYTDVSWQVSDAVSLASPAASSSPESSR